MKRLFCLLLCLCMVVIPIVSCSDDPDKKASDDSKTDSIISDTASQTSKGEEKLEIPDEKLNGYKFNILTGTVLFYQYSLIDFDEPSDDPLANAIYLRNLQVEEMLDVEITQSDHYFGSELYEVFKTAVSANTGDYDATFNNMHSTAAAVGAGYCMPMSAFTYIDLEKSWWNRDCTEQLALGGESYIVCGDIAYSDKECIWAIYFSKEIISQYGLESPYDLVKNNQWTWDKMYEMGKIAAYDENANGTMDYTDVWGFAAHAETWPAFWESAGLRLVEVDNDGIPQFVWGTEEFQNAFEAAAQIMGDSEVVSPDNPELASDAIREGRVLFGAQVIGDCRNYRTSEHQFGILPFPKYSSDIDEYYSHVLAESLVMTIGNDNRDPYKTSIILEALASKGQEIMTPVYYDGQLKSRDARDEESSAMLDIIFEHRIFDLGVYFDWGGAYTSLRDPEANPARLYESLRKAMNIALKKSLEKLGLDM